MPNDNQSPADIHTTTFVTREKKWVRNSRPNSTPKIISITDNDLYISLSPAVFVLGHCRYDSIKSMAAMRQQKKLTRIEASGSKRPLPVTQCLSFEIGVFLVDGPFYFDVHLAKLGEVDKAAEVQQRIEARRQERIDSIKGHNPIIERLISSNPTLFSAYLAAIRSVGEQAARRQIAVDIERLFERQPDLACEQGRDR